MHRGFLAMHAQTLKKWRERNHFSLEDLASVLGVRPEVLLEWENGKRRQPYSLGLVLEEIESKGRRWASEKLKDKVGFLDNLIAEAEDGSRP
ncbi:MAG: helix-turn-helix domain-containing protein [Nitrospirota bacterium]|jgi:transcriptional regulator with XRE-family HTH domain